MISGEHKGIKYTITEEACDDLLKFHGINAIDEFKRGIELELEQLQSTVTIENDIATLHITKKINLGSLQQHFLDYNNTKLLGGSNPPKTKIL